MQQRPANQPGGSASIRSGGPSNDSTPDINGLHAVPLNALSQWLKALSLSHLAESVLLELQNLHSISRLFLLSRMGDHRCRWAYAPDASLRSDVLNRLDDILSMSDRSPESSETQCVGSQKDISAMVGSALNCLGLHGPIILSGSSHCFYLGWDGMESLEPLRSTGHWGALEIALENYAARESLVELTHVDALTHVFNRRHFNQRLLEETERAKRYGRPLSLLVIDLDRFKPINDRHGHQAGDIILRYMAQSIRRSVRNIDILCRLGGDEFAVLMPDSGAVDCRSLGERLQKVFAGRQFSIGGKSEPVVLWASVGGATFPDHAATAERVLWSADMALLEAKKKGGALFVPFDTELPARLRQTDGGNDA